MSNELTPITRKEHIMSGADITPLTREEMFLQAIVEGGGGGGTGLPAYTSADVGKTLTVGEGELVETVVVPEQTITITAETPFSVLTGTVDSALQNIQEGAIATAVINGTTYRAVGIVQPGGVGSAYSVDELHAIFMYTPQLGGALFGINDPEIEGGTYTVSLKAPATQAELKWESSDDTLLITVEGGISNTTYAQAKEALINGKNVKIVFAENGVVQRTGVGTSFVYDESSAFPYQIKYFGVNADSISTTTEDGKLGSR